MNNPDPKSYTIHSDPSHGWLEVPFALVYFLGIGDQVSHCSFMTTNHKTFYLEWDRDAGLFLQAYVERFGTKPNFKQNHVNTSHTQIRRLPRVDWPHVLTEFANSLTD